MDYRAAFQISAAGMDTEKLRIDVTALNLANMNTTSKTEAGAYKPLRVVTQLRGLNFEGVIQAQQQQSFALAMPQASAVPMDVAPRFVHDPSHPHADTRGMVAYPGVEHAGEMVRLVSALRSYEANVAAASATRAMAAKALEIGGGQ